MNGDPTARKNLGLGLRVVGFGTPCQPSSAAAFGKTGMFLGGFHFFLKRIWTMNGMDRGGDSLSPKSPEAACGDEPSPPPSDSWRAWRRISVRNQRTNERKDRLH